MDNIEFNTLIKTQFFPILQKYGFKIIEEFKNILRFQSSLMKVNIVFNEFDRSTLIEIGRRDETLSPLNDYVVKKLFNSKLSVERVIPEIFVQNLSALFQTKEGIAILNGNVKTLKYIVRRQSEEYTSEFIKHSLEVASKAWESNDYLLYVDIIDKIGICKIPQSYQLKYKLAKLKL